MKKWQLSVTTEEEKLSWLKDIRKLIKEFQKKNIKKMTTSLPIGQSTPTQNNGANH